MKFSEIVCGLIRAGTGTTEIEFNKVEFDLTPHGWERNLRLPSDALLAVTYTEEHCAEEIRIQISLTPCIQSPPNLVEVSDEHFN